MNTYQPQLETIANKQSYPSLMNQTPVIQSQAYYPNLNQTQRIRNNIAPAVEPYGLDKQFSMPRQEMYPYDHYQSHLRPAYDQYPYYPPVAVTASSGSSVAAVEKEPKKPKRAARSAKDSKPVEGEDEEERKKRFLERNRLAASKCRQKRKAFTQELELRSSELFQKNRELKMEINVLLIENEKLKQRLEKYEGYPLGL